MGISGSKHVKSRLSKSSEFDCACESAFAECLSLTQHAFQGVLPYQLPTASDHIHATLKLQLKHPLILNWLPSPPARTQIDSALRALVAARKLPSDGDLLLGPALFKEWALLLFADAVAGNAGKALLARVPIGVAGILGVGAVTRSGKDLVGAAIGVYALGVASSIYLSLSG